MLEYSSIERGLLILQFLGDDEDIVETVVFT